MKRFRVFAIFTAASTFFLIFLGGLVRVSGAGLGCPDWPRCFGRWIPPINVSELPVDMDTSFFNFTLAWIEYINRLFGMFVGLLILAVAIVAVRGYRHVPRIIVPAIIAPLLTAFQGWLGGQVVASELAPLMVSAHLLIAVVIGSLMLYIAQETYFLEMGQKQLHSSCPRTMRFLLGGIWLLVALQIVLGTQMRESIERLLSRSPLLADSAVLHQLGSLGTIHLAVGIIVVVGIVIVFVGCMSGKNKPSSYMMQLVWALFGLVVIQLVLGFCLYGMGLPEVVQVLHMWSATVLAGLTMLTFSALRFRRDPK